MYLRPLVLSQHGCEVFPFFLLRVLAANSFSLFSFVRASRLWPGANSSLSFSFLFYSADQDLRHSEPRN